METAKEKCNECGKITDSNELNENLGICMKCSCDEPIDLGYDEI